MSIPESKILELAKIIAYHDGQKFSFLSEQQQQNYIKQAKDQKDRESRMSDDELYRSRGI